MQLMSSHKGLSPFLSLEVSDKWQKWSILEILIAHSTKHEDGSVWASVVVCELCKDLVVLTKVVF